MPARSATSRRAVWTSGEPALTARSTVSARPVSLTSDSASRAPARANSLASARPIPEQPPVPRGEGLEPLLRWMQENTDIDLTLSDLAARSGMSRKSAYALKARDSAFAAAWAMAAAAGIGDRRQGDKARKAREPRNSPGQGDAFAAAVARALDPMPRHSLFRGPRKRDGESPPAALARTTALP